MYLSILGGRPAWSSRLELVDNVRTEDVLSACFHAGALVRHALVAVPVEQANTPRRRKGECRPLAVVVLPEDRLAAAPAHLRRVAVAPVQVHEHREVRAAAHLRLVAAAVYVLAEALALAVPVDPNPRRAPQDLARWLAHLLRYEWLHSQPDVVRCVRAIELDASVVPEGVGRVLFLFSLLEAPLLAPRDPRAALLLGHEVVERIDDHGVLEQREVRDRQLFRQSVVGNHLRSNLTLVLARALLHCFVQQ